MVEKRNTVLIIDDEAGGTPPWKRSMAPKTYPDIARGFGVARTSMKSVKMKNPPRAVEEILS